jgi:hypothetical protein
VFSLRPLLGLAVWVDHFQKARAILRDLDQIAIGAQLLPCLWIRAEDGGTAMREHDPHLEAAGASENLDPHPDERDWLTRLDRTLPHKPRHTLNGIEPAAVLSCVLRAAPPRVSLLGPVTAKVCVLARALRNTRFVKSAAPDPQQNQALRPSFPRAPGGEVSRDTIDGRSTVRPQQRASC